MPRRAPSHVVAILGLAVALAPRGAWGYAEEIHAFITLRALAGRGLEEPAAPIPDGCSAAIRGAIDAFARAHGDAELRAEWRRRYPTPAAFDAWAEKELLLFEPSASVSGIDRPDAGGGSRLDLVVRGSRDPDDDRRNRERIAYDRERRPILDGEGAKIAADPALLNMGKLGALSSQAHAHYGLARVALSSDPAVLKSDPRRFAVAAGYEKGPVLTLAAEMAQEHLDLALLASLVDECASPELTWLSTGQAFHYLEDVSNQIHTVQVGLYDFFVDAFVARLEMAAATGGGYLGRLRSLASIGIDLLTNHHLLSEALTRKRVREGLAGRGTPTSSLLMNAPSTSDAELSARLEAALAALGARPERGEFGLAITRAIIESSSLEGADVYRAIRAIASPRLREEGVLYDDERDDPDAALVPVGKRDPEMERAFYALEERAFRRAGTALRLWLELEQRALEGAATPEARSELRARVLERLVRRQSKLLGEAEARRADYLAHPPERRGAPERMTSVLLGEISLVLLVGGAVVLAWRRRARAKAR